MTPVNQNSQPKVQISKAEFRERFVKLCQDAAELGNEFNQYISQAQALADDLYEGITRND